MFRRFLLLYSLLSQTICQTQPNLEAIRWADHLDPEKFNMDIFFDRIVFFVYLGADQNSYIDDYTVIAPGFLITNELVLTSYNAFRTIMSVASEKSRTIVAVLEQRHITNWHNVTYDIKHYKINCARPLMPLDFAELWVGKTNKHSPVHDLMVARIDTKLNVLNGTEIEQSFDSYGRWGKSSKRAGPIITDVAGLNDEIGKDVKFASIGFINDLHIWRSCYLRTMSYTLDDNVVEDCDEWIHREWGYFICITNTGGFQGVGSGAMLVHNDTLYGVGSFFLKKGADSVLVFTDVRPYRHIMFKSCTKHDQRVPIKFYDPTTTTTTTTTTKPRVSWDG